MKGQNWLAQNEYSPYGLMSGGLWSFSSKVQNQLDFITKMNMLEGKIHFKS